MNKQCVNCPGAQDHSTAECPVMKEQKMASERSAFEQWVVTRKFVSGQGKHYVESCLHRDLAGEYTQGWVHGAWVGWQARTSVLVTMPPEIPRYLLGKIVDELFGGAIEDTSPIEDVYRLIAREYRAAPAAAATSPADCDTAFAARYNSDPADPAVSQVLAIWREAWTTARPAAAVVNQQVTTAQCIWKRDWETGAYQLGCCDQAWHFTDGTAEENGALFCHRCAGKIMVEEQVLRAYQVGDNDIVAAYDPTGAIQVLVDFAGYGQDFDESDVEPVSDKMLDATEAFDQDEGKIIPLEKTLRQELEELTEPAYLHGWE